MNKEARSSLGAIASNLKNEIDKYNDAQSSGTFSGNQSRLVEEFLNKIQAENNNSVGNLEAHSKAEPINSDQTSEFFLRLIHNVIPDIHTSINDLNTRIEASRHEALNIKDDFDKRLKKEFREANERIESAKNSNIGIMSVLIGLFTFVSLEFQIFKSEFTLREASGLSLVALGGMLMFVSAIDFFIKLDLPLYAKKRALPTGPLAQGEEKVSLMEPGFMIRIVFFFLSFSVLFVGTWLFSSNKVVDKKNPDTQITNQGASIEIHGNTVLPPSPQEIQVSKTRKP
jgi:hypothetical protein